MTAHDDTSGGAYEGGDRTVRLSAATVHSARYLLRAPMASWPVRQVRLTIRSWEPPPHGWAGQLGPLPGLVQQRVTLPRRGTGKAVVEVTLSDPTRLRQVLQAALAALCPPGGRLDAIANPIGFAGRHGPLRRHAHLQIQTTEAGSQWRLVSALDGSPLVEWSTSWALHRPHLAVLAKTDVVHCANTDLPPHPVAQLAGQIAMTGVIVSWPDLPPAVAHFLGADTAAAIRQPLPAEDDDALHWDARSVALRRTALRNHGSGFGKRRHDWPSLTVLLATRRPVFVPRILGQLAAQTYPGIEVVLGVHGQNHPVPVDPTLPFPVHQVTVPASAPLGVVLANASARASGTLVTKFDDDDTYGPNHLWDLVLAHGYSQAGIVGKPDEFVYLEQLDTTVRRRGFRHEEYSHWVAGGTILLSRSDLAAVGGWKPVPSSVDRALLDSVMAAGGLVYRTHGFGYLYHRHERGHTWNPGLDYYLTRADTQWAGPIEHPEFGPRRRLR